MGFPLRSNIFRSGTNEQAYFARFPIQVAVLFSPRDRDFSAAFRELFLHLDRLTGNYVAFFAILDPPSDWLEVASDRDWWREYQARIGQSGFSVDDRVLVREIARLFNVEWDYLPSIVVSTNLWMGEFVVTETSPYHIEKQLTKLTDLAKEWGQPNIGHIIEELKESFEFEIEYHPPDDDLRYRFNRLYGVLDTLNPSGEFDRDRYGYIVNNELRSTNITLSQVRLRGDDRLRQIENQSVDKIIEDATGRLVASATVASRVAAFDLIDRLGQHSDIMESFDNESSVMIDTAIRVGAFLEIINDDHTASRLLGNRTEFQNRSWPRGASQQAFDFTPGAQGAWKAFEREINLSVVQAARQARTFKMPDFFALYDSSTRDPRFCKVHTGRNVPVDINQRDWEDSRGRRQRFISLGDAWHVARVMHDSPNEVFDSVITRCIGTPLPNTLLDDWRQIYEIRNSASHTHPLSKTDYEVILEKALSPKNLYVLMKIKHTLLQHTPGKPSTSPVITDRKNGLPLIGEIFTSKILQIDNEAALIKILGYNTTDVIGVLKVEMMQGKKFKEGNFARVEVVSIEKLSNGQSIVHLKVVTKSKPS